MKQFYFGNTLETGYKVLASSEGIESGIQRAMVDLAQTVTELSENEPAACGLIRQGDKAVLFKNSRIQPRIEKGEARATYFSHQYLIEGDELPLLFSRLPKVLSSVKFKAGYEESYDISPVGLPDGKQASKENASAKFITAAKRAIGSGQKIIVHASRVQCEKALAFVAALCEALTPNEREQMSFVIAGVDRRAKDITNGVKLIFCNNSRFEGFKEHYNTGCIYYDYDSGEIIDPDESIRRLMESANKERISNKTAEKRIEEHGEEKNVNVTEDQNVGVDIFHEDIAEKSGHKMLPIIVWLVTVAAFLIAIFSMRQYYEAKIDKLTSEYESVTEASSEPEIVNGFIDVTESSEPTDIVTDAEEPVDGQAPEDAENQPEPQPNDAAFDA